MKVTELIGPARAIASVLLDKIARIKSGEETPDPILLWGPAGTGKTTIARMLAEQWAGNHFCVEAINGQQVTVERVDEWRKNVPYRPLYGDAMIRLVDEVDAASKPAMGYLRTYLDLIQDKAWIGFIATTNKSPDMLDDSIQSRFYDRQVLGASDMDLLMYLTGQQAPLDVAHQIVGACKGNVRQAKLELKKWRDYERMRKAA